MLNIFVKNIKLFVDDTNKNSCTKFSFSHTEISTFDSRFVKLYYIFLSLYPLQII